MEVYGLVRSTSRKFAVKALLTIFRCSVAGLVLVVYRTDSRLQVQDQITGETAWFRFPCGDGAIDGDSPGPASGDVPDALCYANNSAGYRKQVMSEISLSKVNGINADCYYLSVQGPVGRLTSNRGVRLWSFVFSRFCI